MASPVLSARVGATIVWPYFLRIDPDRTRNELVLVRPDGTLSAPTTKDHPVWVIGERSITAGLQPVYEVEGVRVGLAAGPDGTYTDTLARLARNRAQLVALPTHDWQAYAPVQLAHLRARAAEHRLAVVRADWRYGSAVIGPDGALLAATPTDRKQAALLVATVDVTIPGSWYTVTGDWLGVAALAALGVSAAWAALPLRRRRRTGQAVLD